MCHVCTGFKASNEHDAKRNKLVVRSGQALSPGNNRREFIAENVLIQNRGNSNICYQNE